VILFKKLILLRVECKDDIKNSLMGMIEMVTFFRGERREARGERREARGERREARGERREARGERREALGKTMGKTR